MIEDILELIVKLLCIVGGLGLIVVVIMWFGAIPLVAVIFNQAFSGWMLLALLAMMIAVIILIVNFVIK